MKSACQEIFDGFVAGLGSGVRCACFDFVVVVTVERIAAATNNFYKMDARRKGKTLHDNTRHDRTGRKKGVFG
jgi:hypothetical protein